MGSALDIKDLSFSYRPGGPEVVRVGEFGVEAGAHVLLTGGSGSGKSTLLQLICGLLEPRTGVVRVAGTDLSSLRGGARDRFRGARIGMIFQTFNLLHGFSAAENVMAALMFGGSPAKGHRGRAVSLLAELGIDRPDARVEELSVGQQQRVAVARAVACSPALVLADEPTASLDPENARAAMGLIRRACGACGAALLCVSHDPAMVSGFERCVAIGEINRPGAAAA